MSDSKLPNLWVYCSGYYYNADDSLVGLGPSAKHPALYVAAERIQELIKDWRSMSDLPAWVDECFVTLEEILAEPENKGEPKC